MCPALTAKEYAFRWRLLAQNKQPTTQIRFPEVDNATAKGVVAAHFGLASFLLTCPDNWPCGMHPWIGLRLGHILFTMCMPSPPGEDVHTGDIAGCLRSVVSEVLNHALPPSIFSVRAIKSFLHLCQKLQKMNRATSNREHAVIGPVITVNDVFKFSARTCPISSKTAESIPPILRQHFNKKMTPFWCEVQQLVPAISNPASIPSLKITELLAAMRVIQQREHAIVDGRQRTRPLNEKGGLYNRTYRAMVVVNRLVKIGWLPPEHRLTLRLVRANIAPCTTLRGGPRHTRREYFTEEELVALQRNCGTLCDKLLFLLCTRVALRAGALAGLQVASVLHRAPKGSSDVCVRRNEYVTVWDKNITRVFCLDDDISTALDAYLRQEHPAVSTEKNLFFSGPRRSRATAKTMNEWIHKLSAAANVCQPIIRIHTFRRTLVQQLIQHGNTIQQCASFMGHKSHRTTMQFYYLPSQQHLQQTMSLPWHQEPSTDASIVHMAPEQLHQSMQLLDATQREQLRVFLASL